MEYRQRRVPGMYARCHKGLCQSGFEQSHLLWRRTFCVQTRRSRNMLDPIHGCHYSQRCKYLAFSFFLSAKKKYFLLRQSLIRFVRPLFPAPRRRKIHHRQWPLGRVELQLRPRTSGEWRHHQQHERGRRSGVQILWSRHRVYADSQSCCLFTVHGRTRRRCIGGTYLRWMELGLAYHMDGWMDRSRPKSRSKSRSGDYWGSCDHALGNYGRYGEICST